MDVRRRIALGILIAATAIPAVRSQQKQTNEMARIGHALARLTFGERPGDAEEIARTGLQEWIELQLNPQRVEENPALLAKLAALDTLSLSTRDLIQQYPRPKKPVADQSAANPADGERRGVRMASLLYLPAELRRARIREIAPVGLIQSDLVEAKLLRAVLSERQLQEVMTDFWYNHFNVHLEKGAERWLVTSYERDAIRPHVFGKFTDLLKATASHPAMLFYLDNWQSISTEAGEWLKKRRPDAAARGINENYARELLELHTLGVDGGYTQKDVTEVARCFTGWTIRAPRQDGSFLFAPRLHDRGAKSVLGVKIKEGGGREDGEQVLDLLARHPSTARFISFKLAQRFVADEPPSPLVDNLAKEFTRTGGDIRAVLRKLFASPEFWSPSHYRAKTKSPLELIASALRRYEAKVDSGLALASIVARLGQPLYRKVEPTGYPNDSREWLNASTLIDRANFATALASNRLPGVRIDLNRFPGALSELRDPAFQKR